MSNASRGKLAAGAADQMQNEIAELRASRRCLASSAHADRLAIERDLHNGVQQHLAALAVDLQLFVRLAEGDAGTAKALVAEMTGIVREAFDETTRLATRIYPQMLEGRGLAGALRSAASTIGITAVVDVPAVVSASPEITAALYWAWTDALSSAATGSEAAISLLDTEGGLTFEITVAGREPDAHLQRLRDRIEALDGRASIQLRLDAGSIIQGWLPLLP